MNESSSGSVVESLHQILQQHSDEPVYKKLRLRLREMGKNVQNEPAQFRVLQRACRESSELAGELTEAGFGEIPAMSTLTPDTPTADLIQAFNAMVERYWEDW